MRLYLTVGIVIALILMGAGLYYKGRVDKESELAGKLADTRITVLKDGRKIDDEILAADDVDLCAVLGGCVVPDEPVNH